MKSPTPPTRRVNPLIRFFGSVRFGVTMLILTLVYASVLSALAPLRGVLEVTEMQAFRHWLFALLTALLCLAVTIVTVTRIRWNLMNAGVLTVHAGILLLCAGSLWYFGGKIEGDVLLQSPRIQLVSTSDSRVLAELLPENGRGWQQQMPAFGGQVKIEVAGSESAGSPPTLQHALVNASVGDAPAQPIPLTANGRRQPLADGRLALQLLVPPPARTFYSNETAAMYFRPAGENLPAGVGWHSVALHALPIYRERYLDEGYVLSHADGQPAPSERTYPHINLAGLAIPTGWFEHWRIPIQVPIPDADFDLQITGFVPYVAGTRSQAVGGGETRNPAISIRIGPHGVQPLERSLFANEPQSSLVPLATPIEFRLVSSSAERDALLQPLAGPDELEIEVLDPPVRHTVAVSAGQTVAVPGTDYQLTISQLFPAWPLVTPGFENAISPAALVDVQRGELKFQRTVIQRFPQLSQDIDAAGMRKREGFVDDNLRLRYRTSRSGYMLLLADDASLAAGEVTLAMFNEQGGVTTKPLRPGTTEHVDVAGMHLDFTVAELIPAARKLVLPVLEPVETRRPNLGPRGMSAIRLSFRGKGELEGWNDSQWMFFSQYPDVDSRPLTVRPPRGKAWELIYTRQPHELNATLVPGKLSVKFFPGRRSVDSWRSDFVAQVDGGQAVAASVSTNDTFTVGDWTLFQSGASTDHWSYTILGVGNRLGIWPMLLGCTMITFGSMYAFYVKPILRRRVVAAALTAVKQRDLNDEPAGTFNGGRRAGALVESGPH